MDNLGKDFFYNVLKPNGFKYYEMAIITAKEDRRANDLVLEKALEFIKRKILIGIVLVEIVERKKSKSCQRQQE